MADPKPEEKKPEAAEAKKTAKSAEAAKSEEKKPEAAPAGVRVKSLVNMAAKDGIRMVAGEECTLSQAEHDRISKDSRHKASPFFEKV